MGTNYCTAPVINFFSGAAALRLQLFGPEHATSAFFLPSTAAWTPGSPNGSNFSLKIAKSTSVIVLLSILYTLICTSFYFNKRFYGVSAKMSKVQRQVFIQVFWIAMLNFAAAAIYVSMQWVDISFAIIVIDQMTWQAGHGGAAIIYLVFNRTINRRVKSLLQLRIKEATSKATIVGGTTNRTMPVSSAVSHPER
ncbi:hypothetical protein L596_013859 [Steinernema carpocapsae]|uniref:7TM GPCR serpentine receptor class x (Srx) domain-containing protein n=1 Tax=Steinernema carpocapsae TaxID=34508 RepID=A0A4V6A5A5_STECR|nr:hypothetical protein L596_013859 [Steinernema carpocapsae]